MIEDLKLLIELQEIDSAIVNKADIIDAIPQKVSSVEQPLIDTQAVYDKNRQKYENLQKKKRDREQFLDDSNDKIKKLKARISEIKTNKEYQAFLKEIESAEKERHAIEDEILSLMEDLDTLQKELTAQEAKVKTEEEKVGAFKNKLQGDIAEVEKELDELKLRRGDLLKGIDREIYDLYSKILKTKKGLAVVEAKDEICRGCNMNIPPQLFVEIKKNEKIIQCPQCNRILYFPPAVP